MKYQIANRKVVNSGKMWKCVGKVAEWWAKIKQPDDCLK